MYFPCCRSKSISEENLHDNEGGSSHGHETTRPNPIIVGLANHLREHHSSSRNSAMAGCFGFSDSPPKYDDIYAVSSRSSVRSAQQPEDIMCVDGTKSVVAEEGTSDDELPPPSYKESVEMASSSLVINVTVDQTMNNQNSRATQSFPDQLKA